MANHKSAIKRIRQTERRTEMNRRSRSQLRTQVKRLLKAIESNEAEAANGMFSPTVSVIDRSVKKGVLKKGTADRMKSRLSLRLKRLKQGEAAA